MAFMASRSAPRRETAWINNTSSHNVLRTNNSLHGIHEALLNLIPEPNNEHWPPLPKSAQYPDIIEGTPRSIEGTGFQRIPDETS
jgi:hypothetical protein